MKTVLGRTALAAMAMTTLGLTLCAPATAAPREYACLSSQDGSNLNDRYSIDSRIINGGCTTADAGDKWVYVSAPWTVASTNPVYPAD